jgi:integrase/recombinase XerD
VDSCVTEFLEFLSVEKGASTNTIAAYRNDLSQLEDFFSAKKNGHTTIQWPAVVQNQVMDYILYLKNHTYAEATVARKVAAVKSFFSFMQAEGRLKANPTETLASPKVGKSLPNRSPSRRSTSCWSSRRAATRQRRNATARCSSSCTRQGCA